MEKALLVTLFCASLLISSCASADYHGIASSAGPRLGPVTSLRAGLLHYLTEEPRWEPIDDKDNMARMREAVQQIGERKIYEGVDALLDVWLFYDATDNDVGGLARDTLLEFGEIALPAIQLRIRILDFGSFQGYVPQLKNLKEQILKSNKKQGQCN